MLYQPKVYTVDTSCLTCHPRWSCLNRRVLSYNAVQVDFMVDPPKCGVLVSNTDNW